VESAGYSTEAIVMVGALVFLLGLFIGVPLGRRTSATAQKYREVERKLDQVLQDKKLYEDEVVEHFTETAQLLNSLTGSYRDVHNHLAQGATSLCQGQGPVSLEHIDGTRDPSEIPAEFATVQQPLDYAPKSSPDEKGMLNEEFGLDRPPQELVSEEPLKA
jgi:uncharacterized membrane-anchored protein YhcB (DUF1043 family)